MIAFIVGNGFYAVFMYLGQQEANAYIRARYPEMEARGITWGEIAAVVLGVTITALVILGSLLPA